MARRSNGRRLGFVLGLSALVTVVLFGVVVYQARSDLSAQLRQAERERGRLIDDVASFKSQNGELRGQVEQLTSAVVALREQLLTAGIQPATTTPGSPPAATPVRPTTSTPTPSAPTTTAAPPPPTTAAPRTPPTTRSPIACALGLCIGGTP